MSVSTSRLSAERENEILTCVLDIVCADGYEALTMEAVASRTRSSKATLYRHWESKLQLVVAAMTVGEEKSAECIDTGSLSGDLHAIADLLVDSYTAGGLVTGLLRAVRDDAELRAAVREQVLAPATADIQRVFERAAQRGEIDATSTPLHLLGVAALGPLAAEALLPEGTDYRAFMHDYVDHVIQPLLRSGPPATT